MERYKSSNELLERAQRVIPTGSQTFSKSRYSLPQGAAPLFLESGRGAYVEDVDGNRYLDLVNGLLCTSLGYCDQDVDAAVMAQMKKGVSFSLPHRLESEVAERLVELIPCAEQVRFGKNGTDATSAAVRLARAYTGRDHVAVCGYHGWQDWYIGSTSRYLGVPDCVRELTHAFAYNDLPSLEAVFELHPQSVAAVIMEPMNVASPAPGFLEGVRQLCDRHGSVLVFDETVTGFRFHLGGAQALFGVTPDLATFGKGMANGYPLAAVTGRRDIMAVMDRIFFSGTFGGETLSLAAAIAVIDKMVALDVPTALADIGGRIAEGVMAAATVSGAGHWFGLAGHPSWKILQIAGLEQADPLLLKSLLIQELALRGVLTIGSHNVSFIYGTAEIDCATRAYSEAFEVIGQGLQQGNIASLLQGKVIEQVFSVR